MFWWYVLPLGFLLTMYTQTGYDASAHVAEETHEAEIKVAAGLWQSVFYAALFGWFVLLAHHVRRDVTRRRSTTRAARRSRCSRAR